MIPLKAKDVFQSKSTNLPPPPISGSGWILTHRLAVPHVIGTGAAQVGPLQEQIRESVQAEAGGEGAEETVETPEEDAEGPADEEQNHQPDDAPQTRPAICHPSLGGREGNESGRSKWTTA